MKPFVLPHSALPHSFTLLGCTAIYNIHLVILAAGPYGEPFGLPPDALALSSTIMEGTETYNLHVSILGYNDVHEPFRLVTFCHAAPFLWEELKHNLHVFTLSVETYIRPVSHLSDIV